MGTVTVEQATELAYAFAQYTKVQVSELDTSLDCEIAISSCRRLMSIQNGSGIELTTGLKRRIEQLESMKELVAWTQS